MRLLYCIFLNSYNNFKIPYRMMNYGDPEKLPCHKFGIYSILQKKRIFQEKGRIIPLLGFIFLTIADGYSSKRLQFVKLKLPSEQVLRVNPLLRH